jgi:hypothetical protein
MCKFRSICEAQPMSHRCNHPNQSKFPAEINIHFPGIEMLEKPTVWVFPQVQVCLECGFAQFWIDDRELRQLTDSDCRSQSRTAA